MGNGRGPDRGPAGAARGRGAGLLDAGGLARGDHLDGRAAAPVADAVQPTVAHVGRGPGETGPNRLKQTPPKPELWDLSPPPSRPELSDLSLAGRREPGREGLAPGRGGK